MAGVGFCGGTADLAKCFDQVNKELVYELAHAAGMPGSILDAYRRFQEGIIVHNTIVGGIGRGFQRKTSIPQGCPLSMMMMALLMRPWAIKVRATGMMRTRILADDILLSIHAKGSLGA